eukprot:1820460-Rhodomonas_salina.3
MLALVWDSIEIEAKCIARVASHGSSSSRFLVTSAVRLFAHSIDVIRRKRCNAHANWVGWQGNFGMQKVTRGGGGTVGGGRGRQYHPLSLGICRMCAATMASTRPTRASCSTSPPVSTLHSVAFAWADRAADLQHRRCPKLLDILVHS